MTLFVPMLSVACSCLMAVSVWCEWAAKSAFWFSAVLWNYTKSRPIKQGHPGGPLGTKQRCKVGLDVRQLGQRNPNESNTFHDHRHLDDIWIHLSYIDLRTAQSIQFAFVVRLSDELTIWNSWASLGRLLAEDFLWEGYLPGEVFKDAERSTFQISTCTDIGP